MNKAPATQAAIANEPKSQPKRSPLLAGTSTKFRAEAWRSGIGDGHDDRLHTPRCLREGVLERGDGNSDFPNVYEPDMSQTLGATRGWPSVPVHSEGKLLWNGLSW